MDSVCKHCIHYGYDNGCINGPAEQCYEPESWCDARMENFGTDEGCWKFEESCE